MRRQLPDWAGDVMSPRKFERNATELPRYADIESRFGARTRDLVSAFQQGAIPRHAFLYSFGRALGAAETDAFVAGRRAGGVAPETLSPQDLDMLATRHAINMGFLRGFASDIASGTGRMPYAQRATLYARSLWSIYTRGETIPVDDPDAVNARFHWIMDVDAEHCPDCIRRAVQSRTEGGFTWNEINALGWPGETTRCRTNCRCHVRRVAHAVLLPERTVPPAAAVSAVGTGEMSGADALAQILGGPEMPLKISAAGLPFARIDPLIVHNSLAAEAAAPAAAPAELDRLLPFAPAVLVTPRRVIDDGVGHRTYLGHGLRVIVERELTGIWRVIQIALDRQRGKAA